jgi:tetratricopeptide (TPR) repeat protein
MSIHAAFAGLILGAAFVSAAPADPPPKAKPGEKKADPKAAEDFVKLGLEHLRDHALEAAIVDFTDAIRLDPTSVLALDLRALVYFQNREFAKAALDYKRMIELNPRNPKWHCSLARLLAKCPDSKVRDGKKAVEHAVKACELSQWKIESAVEALAEAHAESGEFDKAVKYQKQAMDLKKANGVTALTDQEARLKWFESLVLLSQAVQANPNDPETYYLRGLALAEGRKRDMAIADFSQAIKLNPKSAKFFHERGRVHQFLGSFDGIKPELEKASADFAEAVRLDPKDHLSISSLSETYYELGEYAKAAGVHRKVIENDPNAAGSLIDLAKILAVCPDAEVRDGKKAVEYAKKACEIFEWELDSPIEILAAAHAEAGAFDQAGKYQKKVIETRKANGHFIFEKTKERLRLYEAKKPIRCKSLFSDW